MATTTTKRISGAASGGYTARIAASAAGYQTSRIQHLLLLEGDMQETGSDHLLLEGDMQSGDDVLKLEGDVAAVGGTSTRRIVATVA
jgi:hypothetical protein